MNSVPGDPKLPAIILAEELTKRFGRQLALDRVSFAVGQGIICGVFGLGGAGKTTLLRLLTGQVPPTSGKAQLLSLEPFAHAHRLRRRIGYLGQKEILYPTLSLLQNMQLVSDLRGLSPAASRARFLELCERLEIAPEVERPAGALPQSVKRRAGLAFSLLAQPEVLLLDEPTAGMDEPDQLKLWELLEEVAAAGGTVLFTSHHPEEAEYCGHLVLLQKGRLVRQGAPDEIKTGHVGGARVKIELAGAGGLQDLKAALSALGFAAEWTARPSGEETLRVYLPDFSEQTLHRLRAALARIDPAATLRVDLPSMAQVFQDLLRG